MTLVLIALATFLATLLGGFLALRFKDKLHLILGFSAGAVIAVAFFDLLPEALSLSASTYSVETISTLVAVGFVCYLILDRLILLHHHHPEDGHDHSHHQAKGILGAGSLALHSFLDGVAIGLAFQASTAVGAVVATAVLTHDFSDGINTVNLILRQAGRTKSALSWLLIDALAPVLGVLSTFAFTLSSANLGLVLALFCGFFLYLGASDLLPESFHSHPKMGTTFMTILGMLVLYLAVHLAGL